MLLANQGDYFSSFPHAGLEGFSESEAELQASHLAHSKPTAWGLAGPSSAALCCLTESVKTTSKTSSQVTSSGVGSTMLRAAQQGAGWCPISPGSLQVLLGEDGSDWTVAAPLYCVLPLTGNISGPSGIREHDLLWIKYVVFSNTQSLKGCDP